MSLLPRLAALHRAWPSAEKFGRDSGLSGASFARFHLTVLALIALQIFFRGTSARHAFVFSAAILALNYFPWSVVRAPPRGAGGEAKG